MNFAMDVVKVGAMDKLNVNVNKIDSNKFNKLIIIINKINKYINGERNKNNKD